MAKPLFHDIVPPEKRSIKKIPIPERAQERRGVKEDLVPEAPARAREPRPRKRRGMSPVVISLVVLAVLGASVYFLLPRVSGAEITLTQKGKIVNIDAQFTASSDDGSDLVFRTVELKKDGKVTLPATGQENAQVKAAGVIRIFNNYSSAPQKLVANTRFESPQGKIYRISEAVTVPGKKGDTPGSLDVTITADAPGADFNIGFNDFTIPGFKGDPRYSKIFARSTTAMQGGFSGTRKKVAESQLKAAYDTVRAELESALLKQMQQQMSDDFIFLPRAYTIQYEPLAQIEQGDGVVVGERAIFHAVLFKKSDLAKVISQKAGVNEQGQKELFGVSNLIFTAKPGTSANLFEGKSLTFTLRGTTTLVTGADTDKIKSELAGKPRASLNAVLAGYPSVAKAEVIIRPFWKQNFPEAPALISVKIDPTPISP